MSRSAEILGKNQTPVATPMFVVFGVGVQQ
jgi:hypothetical protein